MKKMKLIITGIVFLTIIMISCSESNENNKSLELEAFVQIDNNLNSIKATSEIYNELMYTQLEQSRINEPKAIPYYNAGLEVRKLTQEMRGYIAELRGGLIHEIDNNISIEEGSYIALKDIKSKNNIETTSKYFLDNNERAKKLRERLIKYREDLVGILKDKNNWIFGRQNFIKSIGNLGIDTDNPKNKHNADKEYFINNPEKGEWEPANFYNMPLAASLVVLNQIDNQVKNAENTVVNKLLYSIGAFDFKFDTLAAKIIPKSNIVKKGDYYEADLFMAAFSTTARPQVFIGESFDSTRAILLGRVDSIPVVRGMGKLKIPTNSVGSKKFAAIIKIKNSSTGEIKLYPIKNKNGGYELEYTVVNH